MNLLLTDGLVYDGSGNPPRRMDILLRDGIIRQIEPGGSTVFPGVTRTDLHGLSVSPGWIDVHAHSDASLFAAPEAFGKISQGVTTEISGNCGLSAFPVLTGEVREHLRTLYEVYDFSPDWTDFSSYAEALTARGPAVNTAFLCGHNTLRANVSGYENRQLPADALAEMQRVLDTAMRQGALGLSTGLLYTPGCFSDETELLALLRTAGASGGIYATHLRSEGDKLEEALEEALTLAENAALPLQISHLKTALPRNWHKLDAVLNQIETARARGIRIAADRYPYTYSQTSLSIVLAAPYDAMTDAAIRSVLQHDHAAYERARLDLENSTRDWSRVILTQSRAQCAAGLAGKNLLDAAGLRQRTPAELVMEILREDAPGSMAAFGGMSEENLRRILERDWVSCGTDETARPVDFTFGTSHPRGFGSFPRYIRLLREHGVPMEKIIQRITAQPAAFFHLSGRGVIRPGAAADLVVFNEEELDSEADFTSPHTPAAGIRSVYVNGVAAYDGELRQVVARPGRVLKRQ